MKSPSNGIITLPEYCGKPSMPDSAGTEPGTADAERSDMRPSMAARPLLTSTRRPRSFWASDCSGKIVNGEHAAVLDLRVAEVADRALVAEAPEVAVGEAERVPEAHGLAERVRVRHGERLELRLGVERRRRLRRDGRDVRRGAGEREGGDDLLPANRRGAVSAGLVQRSYPLVRRALSTRGRSSRALRKRARLARVSLHSFWRPQPSS